MDKKKLILIIAGTVAVMGIVVAALLFWLLPGKKEDASGNPTTATGTASGEQSGNAGGENVDPTGTLPGGEIVDPTGTLPGGEEPTVGVEIEIPGNGGSGNGGSGNGGSGNGSSGNNEIDFDDLLGNG